MTIGTVLSRTKRVDVPPLTLPLAPEYGGEGTIGDAFAEMIHQQFVHSRRVRDRQPVRCVKELDKLAARYRRGQCFHNTWRGDGVMCCADDQRADPGEFRQSMREIGLAHRSQLAVHHRRLFASDETGGWTEELLYP